MTGEFRSRKATLLNELRRCQANPPPRRPSHLPVPGQQRAACAAPIQLPLAMSRQRPLIKHTARGTRVTCEFGEPDRINSRWQEAAHVEVAVVVEQNSAAVVEFDFA